jgi:hypothetical protein
VLAAALQIFFWHSPERHAGFKLWLSSGRSAVRNSRVMSRLHEDSVIPTGEGSSRLPACDHWQRRCGVLRHPRWQQNAAAIRLLDHKVKATPVGIEDLDLHSQPRMYNRTARKSHYRLADEPSPVIEVACSKCEWKAAFSRAELLAMYGAECPLPTLLNHLAMPDCSKINTHWNRCGVYYVNPIDGREW